MSVPAAGEMQGVRGSQESPAEVPPEDGRTTTAWQVPVLGEPQDVMRQVEVRVPGPGEGEVLVEVWSAALNFPDVLLARGAYQDKPPLPFTPGVELCGEIVGVGPGVEPTRLGSRVVGMPRLPHGALAGYALARSVDMLPAPAAFDDATASAFVIAYHTAWFGLYRRAGLRVGETLLVHAAAGGAGSAAVQLGRLAGARVIAVVGGREKAEVARGLGADVVIDRTARDIIPAIKEAVGDKGVDVVYDPVGGDAYTASTKVIAFEGRIVVVGFAGGTIPTVALNHALVKNYSILGLHWGLYRTRRPDLIRRAHEELMTFAAADAVRPLVSRRLAFGEAAEGLAALASGSTVGRLTVAPPQI